MPKEAFPLLESCNPKNCIVSMTMKINRLMNKIFRKHLEGIDITLSQLGMMFLISKKEVIEQHQIGEILILEKSTVTRNLKRLIDGGFLLKKIDRKIYVTTKGKRLVEKAIPKWDNAMSEAREIIKQNGVEAINHLLNKLNT